MGKMNGSVEATEKEYIRKDARLVGDVQTSGIVIVVVDGCGSDPAGPVLWQPDRMDRLTTATTTRRSLRIVLTFLTRRDDPHGRGSDLTIE